MAENRSKSRLKSVTTENRPKFENLEQRRQRTKTEKCKVQSHCCLYVFFFLGGFPFRVFGLRSLSFPQTHKHGCDIDSSRKCYILFRLLAANIISFIFSVPVNITDISG